MQAVTEIHSNALAVKDRDKKRAEIERKVEAARAAKAQAAEDARAVVHLKAQISLPYAELKAANDAREKELLKLQEQLNAAVEAKAAAEARAKELQDLKQQLQSTAKDEAILASLQAVGESLSVAGSAVVAQNHEVNANVIDVYFITWY